MANEQLISYVRAELGKGANRDDLIRSLLAAGWKADDVNAAMSAMAGSTTPSAPPVPRAPAAPNPAVPSQEAVEVSSVKTTVQNAASGFFVACVTILTVISILGVWKIFEGNVITKSFETLGLLAFVAVVVIVASKFVGDSHTIAAPNPTFRAVRNITLGTLIVSAALLALFGVLSIWDIITDKDFLYKTLSSLAIIAFSSFIIVVVSLEREQNQFWKKRSGQISGGAVVLTILFFWLMFAFLLRF